MTLPVKPAPTLHFFCGKAGAGAGVQFAPRECPGQVLHADLADRMK